VLSEGVLTQQLRTSARFFPCVSVSDVPSLLRRCWLGYRKGIWHVKIVPQNPSGYCDGSQCNVIWSDTATA